MTTEKTAVELAIEALEMALNGCDWFKDMHPEHSSPADDEFKTMAMEAIAALRTHQPQKIKTHGKECSLHNFHYELGSGMDIPECTCKDNQPEEAKNALEELQ